MGEHFGSASDWLLAVRYDGGSPREPAVIGATFHHTALYEFLYLLVLFGAHDPARPPQAGRPARSSDVFCAFYGTARFLSDFLRVNDETVLGLTGAQWLMLTLPIAAIWIFRWVRPSVADADADDTASAGEGLGDDAGDGGDGPVGGLGGAELVGPEEVGHDPQHPLHEGA